jgi:hypothetical protein
MTRQSRDTNSALSEDAGAFVEEDPSAETVGVRAYLMTGGRSSGKLAYETMLSPVVEEIPEDVQYERAAILEACKEKPLSVAEISALIPLPIGVVRVLASDLVAENLLVAYKSPENQSTDVTLLTNLIEGVRAL